MAFRYDWRSLRILTQSHAALLFLAVCVFNLIIGITSSSVSVHCKSCTGGSQVIQEDDTLRVQSGRNLELKLSATTDVIVFQVKIDLCAISVQPATKTVTALTSCSIGGRLKHSLDKDSSVTSLTVDLQNLLLADNGLKFIQISVTNFKATEIFKYPLAVEGEYPSSKSGPI